MIIMNHLLVKFVYSNKKYFDYKDINNCLTNFIPNLHIKQEDYILYL